MDENLFIEDYMKPLNDKLAAEDKKTHIAGDFNFDLLNTSCKESFNFLKRCQAFNYLLLPTDKNKPKNTHSD